MNAWKRGVCLSLFGLLVPAVLAAQATVVTGTVRTTTGEPVRGAFVSIEAMQLSTVTNDAGLYRLTVPAGRATGTATLRIRSIGFRDASQEVRLVEGQTIRADATLVEEAIALEEVLVTGTAGRLERRAQSAVIAKIDASRVSEVAPINSVTTLLQARVPGVSIYSGSGSVGTAPRIRIRGAASISLSNEPLVFVDGVRADSRQSQIFSVVGQSVSRLNDLAPEDIESIEVVKGPAAATLYGADASAGVINIITKRGRATGGYTQTISGELSGITTNFDPPANFATCSANNVRPVAQGGVEICQGKAAGDVVSDNPLARLDPFRTGLGTSIAWSLRGGGDRHGVFISATGDQENGSLPSNEFRRITWRSNFDFVPTQAVRIEGGFGLSEARTRLPYSDNSVYGFVAAGFLGNPLTVGTSADGLYSGAGVGGVTGRSAIQNVDRALRIQPRVSVSWNPTSRFTHRLTLGGDLTRTRAWAFFPKNDQNWYANARTNSGTISEGRQFADRWTADYLGNFAADLSPALRADLSWGFQTIINRIDLVTANGVGLVANAARSVGAASERTGDQSLSEDRSNGVLGQIQLSHRDRLFFQVAGRLDRNSAFGAESKYFFSPRVGLSYVISDEDFWQNGPLGAIGTMRLRAAYGTTGRSPTTGALATYTPSVYVLPISGGVESGVEPLNPGNSSLKPERGTEFEVGFEAGLFDERLSLEATYFHKTTTDAILSRPIAPSLGFGQNPLFNIGEILNSGFELAATVRVLTLPNLGWEQRFTVNTLKNEVTDLGAVEPFGTLYRTREGAPVGSFHTYVIRRFDLTNNVAIVSDSLEFVGNVLPGFVGTAGTTINFLRNFTLYGQLDFRADVMRYEGSAQFRDRQFRNSEKWVRRNDVLTQEERLARYGPFRTEDGRSLTFGNVAGAYIEDAKFLRLREVSLSYRVPQVAARTLLRASEASISVSGRNLATWTPYTGLDPEAIYAANTEFFTVPADRRVLVRLSLRY